MDSLKGQLLLASPALGDPNFRRTVVLCAEHNDEGAMGVVLNRPTGMTVEEVVPALGEIVEPDDSVWVGGPVQPSAVIVLAEFEALEHAGLLVFDDVGFLAIEADAHDGLAATRRHRVFAGYAGWGPGQLEAELDEESWVIASPDREELFGVELDDLWAEVLRRKGGTYALLATMPPDPSLN